MEQYQECERTMWEELDRLVRRLPKRPRHQKISQLPSQLEIDTVGSLAFEDLFEGVSDANGLCSGEDEVNRALCTITKTYVTIVKSKEVPHHEESDGVPPKRVCVFSTVCFEQRGGVNPTRYHNP